MDTCTICVLYNFVVKIKFTLEQTMKAHKGSSGIVLSLKKDGGG